MAGAVGRTDDMMDGMLPAALGIYSVADAERITGAPRHQIHGWLQGYP